MTYATYAKSIISSETMPDFIEPLFANRISNGYLAQVIDRNGNVSAFNSISIDDVDKEISVDIDFECNIRIGDSGVYGFRIDSDRYKIGSKSDVSEFLHDNLELLSSYSFVFLDVIEFLEFDDEFKLKAIEQAASRIANDKVRKDFLDLEIYSLGLDETGVQITNLINRLRDSGSFATTHRVIELLRPLVFKFRSKHYISAFDVCVSNNQVSWISTDSDVKDFIERLIYSGRVHVTPEQMRDLGLTAEHND